MKSRAQKHEAPDTDVTGQYLEYLGKLAGPTRRSPCGHHCKRASPKETEGKCSRQKAQPVPTSWDLPGTMGRPVVEGSAPNMCFGVPMLPVPSPRALLCHFPHLTLVPPHPQNPSLSLKLRSRNSIVDFSRIEQHPLTCHPALYLAALQSLEVCKSIEGRGNESPQQRAQNE